MRLTLDPLRKGNLTVNLEKLDSLVDCALPKRGRRQIDPCTPSHRLHPHLPVMSLLDQGKLGIIPKNRGLTLEPEQ